MTYTCVNKLTTIGSDNGLSLGRRQAIIWNNVGILLIGHLGTNFSENQIEILTFSFKKMRLKMSSGKWRSFCLGLNVLRYVGFHNNKLECDIWIGWLQYIWSAKLHDFVQNVLEQLFWERVHLRTSNLKFVRLFTWLTQHVSNVFTMSLHSNRCINQTCPSLHLPWSLVSPGHLQPLHSMR